jgi:hypothetical protein
MSMNVPSAMPVVLLLLPPAVVSALSLTSAMPLALIVLLPEVEELPPVDSPSVVSAPLGPWSSPHAEPSKLPAASHKSPNLRAAS